jgi:hypothetical protein
LAGLISSSELSDSALTLLRLAGVGAFLGVGVAFLEDAADLGLATAGLDSGSGEDSSMSIGFWRLAGAFQTQAAAYRFKVFGS